MKKTLKIGAFIAAVLVGAWLLSSMLHLIADAEQFQNNDEASIAERVELRDDLEQNEAAVQLLTDQLESLGQEPVVEPPSSTTPTIAPGSNTPSVDLLRSLVRFAVESACGGPSCVGPVGPPSTTPGPPGTNGNDGRNGADSTVPGPQGPVGAPGTNGRGITSGPTCQADGSWSTTYTDGSVETQPGPCRFIPAPDAEQPLEPAA